jgi:hypothetical protein
MVFQDFIVSPFLCTKNNLAAQLLKSDWNPHIAKLILYTVGSDIISLNGAIATKTMNFDLEVNNGKYIGGQSKSLAKPDQTMSLLDCKKNPCSFIS